MSEDIGRGNPTDVPTRNAGVGHYSAFLCGKCHKTKQTNGRRITHVLGLRTYVCAACAPAKTKGRA